MAHRQVIVGDLHGCLEEFKLLLEKVDYDPLCDEILLVGDLINKGPKSLEILEFVRDFPKAKSILGNHERRFLSGAEIGIFPTQELEDLADLMGDDLEEWCRWIASWPLFLEFEDYLVVHAGLIPGHHPSETSARILTEIRTWDGSGESLKDPSSPPWYELYEGDKLVVYGHWARQGLLLTAKTIGLDSGCVYGEQLSCVVMPSKEVFQVSAKKRYASV